MTSEPDPLPQLHVPALAWAFIGAALVIVAGGIIALVLDWPRMATETWEAAGQRGDFFGGHLAAASGLASALLFVAALFIQGVELRAQRHGMERAIAVHRAQEQQLKRQVALAEKATLVSRVLELSGLRHRLIDDRKRSVPESISGSPEEVEARMKARNDTLARWNRRIRGTEKLLNLLLSHASLDSDEREALSELSGMSQQ